MRFTVHTFYNEVRLTISVYGTLRTVYVIVADEGYGMVAKTFGNFTCVSYVCY